MLFLINLLFSALIFVSQRLGFYYFFLLFFLILHYVNYSKNISNIYNIALIENSTLSTKVLDPNSSVNWGLREYT